MTDKIGTEAAQLLFREYRNEIFFAVNAFCCPFSDFSMNSTSPPLSVQQLHIAHLSRREMEGGKEPNKTTANKNVLLPI